ncbi:type II toxin-antitoxin system RelE/ParE family toxin [Novosphingobium soli]|uniref:Type II toxin-antitoxin system RelE/ParE family toxin n=1 Tax=Novosphingobium soli TaxID=574956 RepID=A0ABV6CWW9_9SPHN
MLQTVVELPEFLSRAKAIMSDEERMALVNFVAGTPEAGISLGGGLRKLRFARPGAGKSGGYRTIYVFGGRHAPFLVTVFAKTRALRRFVLSAYESIRQGLAEALDFARDGQTDAQIHQIEVPVVDVAAIRASTGLSQGAFARSIGVAKGTLLNWEHGRRRPTGPAQVLLAMIAKKPSLVTELLR